MSVGCPEKCHIMEMLKESWPGLCIHIISFPGQYVVWPICGVANTFKISLKSLLEVEIQTKT